MSTRHIAVGALLCVVLTACSGGPGKSDIEQALTQHFEQASGGLKTTFENLEVGACAQGDGGPGYACAVQAQVQLDVGGRVQRESLTGTFVFDEVGGRWVVTGTR